MNKSYSLLLTLIFCIILSSPLIIMQFTEKKDISLTEKRQLARMPQLSFTTHSLSEYPQQLENYFNDHFGLRDYFIKLYNYLFLTTLQKSPKFTVVLGNDKWLFLNVDFVLHDFLGQYQFDKKRLQRWKRIARDREQWLADKGIKYLLLPTPNKIMIYPEYMPERILAHKGRTNLDQFLEFLNKPPKFESVLDLRPPLFEAKKYNQVYLKADTHWNYDGSYAAYNAIMNHINKSFPDLHPTPKHQLIRQYKSIQGDLSLILNLGPLYKEKTSLLRIPDFETKIKYQTIKREAPPSTEFQSFRKGDVYINENPEQKLTAIFISDSFGHALREFLTQHFKRIIFVENARFEDIIKLINKEHPDVVFDINVARGLYVAMGESIELKHYVMQKQFNNLEQRDFDYDENTLQQTITASEQITFKKRNETTQLIVNGSDPKLFTNINIANKEGVLNLHFQMTSPKETIFKVYYQTVEKPFFTEGQVISYPIHQGENNIYFRIYAQQSQIKLRIDPSDAPGTYHLQRFAGFIEEM